MSTISEASIQEILEQFDGYIASLAWRSIPRSIVRMEMVDLEVDELIQRVRIKLWSTLQRQTLTNIKGYIKRIVQTEVVDMIRRHKPTLSLPVDEDGEPGSCRASAAPMVYRERIQDPSYEFEQEESFNDLVMKAAQAVCKLPTRQRYALICSLTDKLDECLQLIAALKDRGQDIEKAKWPENKEDKQRLKASLSISRKKLRTMIEIIT